MEVINNGESGLVVRNKLNSNFDEAKLDAAKVSAVVAGTTAAAPIDADHFSFRGSVSGLWSKVTGSNLKVWLKTYFDSLYQASAKDASGGYAGLTLFKLNLKNAIGTVTSWFTTPATTARTWTMPDKDGTVAMLDDIPTELNISKDLDFNGKKGVGLIAGSVPGDTVELSQMNNALGNKIDRVEGKGLSTNDFTTTLKTSYDAIVLWVSNNGTNILNHIGIIAANPHGVTKAHVGLSEADNTSDVNKPTSNAQSLADAAILSAAKTYAEGLIVGLWNDRGSFDASVNTYPSAGGSGSSGSIMKGDIWTVSVVATSGPLLTVSIGSTVRAATSAPGQLQSGWSITNIGLGYTPENVAKKDASGGYAGLTLLKLNLRNAANTITSWFTTAATVARTWTMPDKDGIVALTQDITPATIFGSVDPWIVNTANSIRINGIRYGKSDGGFIDGTDTTIILSGLYDYILANCTGSSVVLTKGVKSYFWQENSLPKDQFVLLYRNNGIYGSQFPTVQRQLLSVTPDLISDNAIIQKKLSVGKLVISSDSCVPSVSATSITLNSLRYCPNDGSFKDYTGNATFEISGAYDYLLANISTGSFVITKGVKSYFWQELPYLTKDQFVLCYKSGGVLSSDFPKLQEIISREVYPHATPILTVEKVIKVGGTIGVNCDFTDIRTALESITDSGYSKRYILRLLDGVYDHSGAMGTYDNNGIGHYLGIKNYVSLIGQSLKNTIIIKRIATYSPYASIFDAVWYSGLQYVLFKNITFRTLNCKCPIHCDTDTPYLTRGGVIEIDTCALINENTTGVDVDNCLALGLYPNQHVICRNVYANGTLWAHNSKVNVSGDGCSFELYNCMAKRIRVGDLISYSNDKIVMRGCNVDHFSLDYFKDFVAVGDAHLRTYIIPSFCFSFEGNKIDWIDATIVYDGGGAITETDAMKVLYNGKWAVTDGSIHKYIKNDTSILITKNTLISQTLSGIEPWTVGKKLYGMAMEDIMGGDLSVDGFGIVQYSGILFMIANATTAINYNDAVELNSTGVVVKYGSGQIVGYAKQALVSGLGTIKVKLI